MAAAKRPAKNGWLWSTEGSALSDTTLRILLCPSAKGGASAEEIAAMQARSGTQEEYRLHSVVLAANSAYFKHRLLSGFTATSVAGTGAHDDPPGTPDSSEHADTAPDTTQGATTLALAAQVEAQAAALGAKGVHVIEERLAQSDTAAARAVLRHMYTEELEYDSPSHLVSILKIADKWQAGDTVDACRVAFSQLERDDLDLEVIKQVYSLEGIIHDVANFAELVEAVKEQLVHMFCDVVDVVTNPTTRNKFLQLPLAAVVALLRSRELLVDSENSVVVAANLWIVQGKGRATTPEQRRFLAGAINLPGVSPSYLCGVLPNLKWFTPPNQPFLSWAQALPGPYYAELQHRLVCPGSKPLVHTGAGSRESAARPGALDAAAGQKPGDGAGGKSGTGTPRSGSPIRREVPPPSGIATPKGRTTSLSVTDVKRKGSAPAEATEPAPSTTEPAPPPPANPREAAAAAVAAAVAAGLEPPARLLRDQNLEIECEIEAGRLRQYIADGYTGLMAGAAGFHGVHVMSECTFFKGFMWGVKLVFGYSSGRTRDGAPPPFTVTPSPFACLPPGEEGIRPLVAPITTTFRCVLEAVGPNGAVFASATYQGASYLRPGEEHVSSIGIANFFKRVPQQHLPEAWQPFLVNDKLRLKLRVLGSTVE